jgi:hypothetical protein
MTIRQYIKRRVLWGFGAFVGAGVISFALGSLVANRNLANAISLIAMFAGVVGYLSALFIRCPKCRANLSLTIAIPTAAHIFGRKVQYCPYCAVSLDDPMPPRP